MFRACRQILQTREREQQRLREAIRPQLEQSKQIVLSSSSIYKGLALLTRLVQIYERKIRLYWMQGIKTSWHKETSQGSNLHSTQTCCEEIRLEFKARPPKQPLRRGRTS